MENAYLNQPCSRCGSKRRVSKKWKEKMPSFTGAMSVVEHMEIVCTNAACEKAFQLVLRDEEKKREALRLKKEENDNLRKAHSLSQAKSARKNLVLK